MSAGAQAGVAPQVEAAAPVGVAKMLVNQTNKRLVLRRRDGVVLTLGKEARNVAELLDLLPPDGDGGPPRLRVILDTIRDEEWMDALRYWRDPVHAQEQTLRYPEDFQP